MHGMLESGHLLDLNPSLHRLKMHHNVRALGQRLGGGGFGFDFFPCFISLNFNPCKRLLMLVTNKNHKC